MRIIEEPNWCCAARPSGIGMDLAELDANFEGNFDANEAIVEESQKALAEAGHWGVPNLVFKGEPFFGQDRLDLCVWRMKQHGLTERN